MSLSSFFPSRRPPPANPPPPTPGSPSDALDDLRFSLEIMPGSRKYVFTPAARAEILSKLYASFFGPHASCFLPQGVAQVPAHALLSEYQASVGFGGMGGEQKVVRGRPCSHIFKKGESCFRCKDCALDESCVMCAKCFHATDHIDHNVSFFIAQQPGGCCDCGDEEAWRVVLGCPYHPPLSEQDRVHDDDGDEAPQESGATPKASSIPLTPSEPMMPDSLPPPVANYPLRVPLPANLKSQMSRTLAFALDYILSTLDHSPDEPSVPTNEADLRMQPSADPMLKDAYCVVIWNDDKHSFDEVTKLLVDMTNRSREDALAVAYAIDENGREIVDMNTNVGRLLEMALAIGQIDLGVTIRRAYDTFCEQVVSVIIEWLLDLTRACVGTDMLFIREVIAEELLKPRRRWDSGALARWDSGPSSTTYPSSSYSASGIKPSHNASPLSLADWGPRATRLDAMFLYHTRLWKKPRLSLKEVYASLISLSRPHKLAVATHFANIYHKIIDAYLLIDREAETSIKYFALQLFTVPSVAAHIMKHCKIVSRLLYIITSFFTNMVHDRRIVYPMSAVAAFGGFYAPPGQALSNNNFNMGQPLDVESFPFKSKRFMPVFSDLRYLCHTAPVQFVIAHNPAYIQHFAKTCQLFMCVNPNKRAVALHVEYETDAWISVFNVTLSLSRVIKVYGEAFGGATCAELVGAIGTVIHHILLVTTIHSTSSSSLDPNAPPDPKFTPVQFHDVSFGRSPSPRTYRVVHFDVLEGWVSFHHSLHWLLAELFKHVDKLDESVLRREVGVQGGLRECLLMSASEQALLSVVDFPLRVLAMIAQIRTGLWVRNGFAIRGQLLHYRDYMLRELCYDQDLFILQTALVIFDPNLILVTILDRFGLLGYFSGAFLHSTYEGTQLSSMVEEVLYVLVTILSENANPGKMDTPNAVRREIVHALAMGPCTFSDLVKRVAERLVDDICFERMLKEVANFRAPESATDSGVYELKDSAYDEVNPFFYHYTRNKREEVENVLRARLRKQTGVQDPVIVPKPFGVTEGPFSKLTMTFEAEALLQIMFYSLYNVLVLTESTGSAPPSAEAILDQALHLVMLGVVEREAAFSRLAAVVPFEEEKSLVDVICALEHHEKYKNYKTRVQWILGQMEVHVPDEIRSRRRVLDVRSEATAEDAQDAKKRAAKARQDAIMQQMKAQQASFATNFDDAEMEDEEDMEVVDEQEMVTYGTCIVCQENLDATRPFGALGLVQPSRFIRKHPDTHNTYLNEVLQAGPSMDRATSTSSTGFPPSREEILESGNNAASPNFDGYPSAFTRFGLHASVCSHMMHLDCFQAYSITIRQRHRAQATRNHPENIPRKEYICPLCKSLGNIILPVANHSATPILSSVPFPDWIRSAGISILKSKPDPLLESLQFRNGTGEFVFWSAQDPGYPALMRSSDRHDGMEGKMLDTVMVVSKSFSLQTKHLRERPEPEAGERGAGIYLPEELLGYTVSSLEIAMRGTGAPGTLVVDHLSDSQTRMIRGLLACLTRLVSLQFKGRPDEGRDAVRQAIIKRLLPEWSRTSLTSFSYPLLLRDPFTVLVETAAVAPEMLRHVLVLTYYACLARAVIGLVYILSKTRAHNALPVTHRTHEDIFGDVRMFFMSVVRHSPVFEHTANLVFETFGESRIEKLLYSFTLPFLRCAAMLCRAILPADFPTPEFGPDEPTEYTRLLDLLGIPPLSDLPHQDTLQNALSGWCAHYGHSHAASSLNCSIMLDYPIAYRLARLPLLLDSLFGQQDKALTCPRCNTVPTDAAICLLCGTTCCMQSNCCTDTDHNDRGECNMHSRQCGGTIGIYFLVKRCSLLYLNASNGTFAQSPYLDAHGEVDISMRRGRRQYLHHQRWEEIRRTWLNHGIPTVVARKLESSMDAGGWETL